MLSMPGTKNSAREGKSGRVECEKCVQWEERERELTGRIRERKSRDWAPCAITEGHPGVQLERGEHSSPFVLVPHWWQTGLEFFCHLQISVFGEHHRKEPPIPSLLRAPRMLLDNASPATGKAHHCLAKEPDGNGCTIPPPLPCHFHEEHKRPTVASLLVTLRAQILPFFESLLFIQSSSFFPQLHPLLHFHCIHPFASR